MTGTTFVKLRTYKVLYHWTPAKVSFIVAGAFMGFDDSEMDGSDSEPDVEGQRAQPKVPILNEPDNLPIFEDQLLDGLQVSML